MSNISMKQMYTQVYMLNPINTTVENQSRVFNNTTDLERYLYTMKHLSNNYLFMVYYTIHTPLEHNSYHINNGSYYADFSRLPPTSTASVKKEEVKFEPPLTKENYLAENINNQEAEEIIFENGNYNEFHFESQESQYNNDEETFKFKDTIIQEQPFEFVEDNSGENISLNMEDRPPSTDNTDWHFVEEKKELKNKFEGMTMRKHGRGYLLQCVDDHPDYGEKYYPTIGDSKAWWQNCNQGWFLRRENKKFFLDNGAEFVFT